MTCKIYYLSSTRKGTLGNTTDFLSLRITEVTTAPPDFTFEEKSDPQTSVTVSAKILEKMGYPLEWAQLFLPTSTNGFFFYLDSELPFIHARTYISQAADAATYKGHSVNEGEWAYTRQQVLDFLNHKGYPVPKGF